MPKLDGPGGVATTGPPFRPWDDFYRGSKRVVFGHWARRGLVVRPQCVGLDTGCVYGGQLSAWIAEDDRVLYHGALAHGANHLVTLVGQAMDMLRRTGAEDPAATLRPLLQAALDNSLGYGDAALTGPIVRGDVETVRAHLTTMRRTSGDALESYVAMGRATAGRAVLDGRLQPGRAEAILEVLDAALLRTGS